ncbi:Peptidase family S49 [Chelatococcus sambhunathii]|uniref:Peptidase family S49 n=1 Tax=Chelatococcus sambhunathii TaxID=363953 RepID=A0ABM9U993_9HYPH|nr:S49 family peptidase [Chelatococcus sambhunathii]CUA90906.1 Peptidase family S49 [Chelatococcus sambhunathii]
MTLNPNVAAEAVAHLAARPLLVHEAHALEVVQAYINAEAVIRDPEASAAMAAAGTKARYQVERGVAIIPITGPLVSRGDMIGDGYRMTSYGAIATEFARAADDPSIRAIVAAVNSPGGTVEGVLGAAGAIRAARAAKPVVAHVTSMAASAGYWLASQADEIVLADDLAQVGSIGVYTMHMDISGLLEKVGVQISLISSGRHKVDGHPFAPLPSDVRGSIQQEIDDLRLMFAREVAAGRSARGLTSDLALATEARMFRALNVATGDREAIAMKLADSVGTRAAVLASLTSNGRGSRRIDGGHSMGMNAGAPGAETSPGILKADHDAAVAKAREDGRAEGHAAGLAEGRKAERERRAAIVGSEEAQGREAAAAALADTTDLSADEAKRALAAMPKAGAAGIPPLAQRASDDPSAGAPDGSRPTDKGKSGAAYSAEELAARVAGNRR